MKKNYFVALATFPDGYQKQGSQNIHQIGIARFSNTGFIDSARYFIRQPKYYRVLVGKYNLSDDSAKSSPTIFDLHETLCGALNGQYVATYWKNTLSILRENLKKTPCYLSCRHIVVSDSVRMVWPQKRFAFQNMADFVEKQDYDWNNAAEIATISGLILLKAINRSQRHINSFRKKEK